VINSTNTELILHISYATSTKASIIWYASD